MPQRHGRPHNSRQLASAAQPEPPPPLFQQPSQLPQPPPSIRNPWAGGVESDHGTSSSASIPPPRPVAHCVRSRSSSIASSSRAPSRSFGAPGCCSPGVQLVCHYCLRAALLCCLLSGAALAVAGAVLQRHEHNDLGVLLYIGVLAALVSLVLLLVQWRSQRPGPAAAPRPRPRGPAPLPEEAVPLQELQRQPVLLAPQQQQHTQISGSFPTPAWHLLPPPPAASVNPYQFQHGLTIPQQSARSEDMMSTAGGESHAAGRTNRPASIAMVPATGRTGSEQWWRTGQQPRPPPGAKTLYHINQPL